MMISYCLAFTLRISGYKATTNINGHALHDFRGIVKKMNCVQAGIGTRKKRKKILTMKPPI